MKPKDKGSQDKILAKVERAAKAAFGVDTKVRYVQPDDLLAYIQALREIDAPTTAGREEE